MKDNEYADYIIFANALINRGSFSNREAKESTGLKPRRLKSIIIRLSAWGILTREGDRPIKYTLSGNAIDVINGRRAESEKKKEIARAKSWQKVTEARLKKEKKEADLFLNGITVVEKANVKGMGCSHLKRIDSLLSGVRV